MPITIATPAERFAALAVALRAEPDVSVPSDEPGSPRGFGANGLKVRRKLFALLVRDQLVVKLPRVRVDTLVAANEGERYDPRRDGRLMREWLCLRPTSKLDWLTLAREALEFVRAQP